MGIPPEFFLCMLRCYQNLGRSFACLLIFCPLGCLRLAYDSNLFSLFRLCASNRVSRNFAEELMFFQKTLTVFLIPSRFCLCIVFIGACGFFRCFSEAIYNLVHAHFFSRFEGNHSKFRSFPFLK